jgi:glyceraldehyde 3-phosphate dehydrogenase
MNTIRVAINGFGRIGRIFCKQAIENPNIEIVAVNDLGSPANLAYLFQYDSVYGKYEKKVSATTDSIVVGDKTIQVLQIKEPSQLPWKDLDIDIVIESTGLFTTSEQAKAHIDAGAKRVIISAPAKDKETPTATPNIHYSALSENVITSNASCTTNATTPVIAIMMASIGIQKAMMSTVHAYTATQALVDGPDKKDDFRRARAAAVNIVPSTTGAAEAVSRTIPEMTGKFDGLSIRVPVIAGSLIDFTFLASRKTTVEEVNEIFTEAAQKPEWQDILEVATDPLVSSDILRNTHGSIVELGLTKVVDGDLVKIMAWYDNEWGYCNMLIKHLLQVATLL